MADPLRINPAQAVGPAKVNTAPKTNQPGGPSFADALSQAQNVRFSSHAQKRMEARDIQLGDDGLARLTQAVDQVAQKGGKESLVLMDDLAFIVNIKDRLVVTALDGESRKGNIFTQIDSVVIAEGSQVVK
jgi:flagellar operon protein